MKRRRRCRWLSGHARKGLAADGQVVLNTPDVLQVGNQLLVVVDADIPQVAYNTSRQPPRLPV